MSTKKEKARELMQNWVPWSKIVDEVGYGSGTYEELRLFVGEIGGQTYEDLRARIKRVAELRVEIAEAEKTLAEQKRKQAELSRDIEEKEKEGDRLKSINLELNKRFEELRTSNSELIEKGVDDEVIRKIRDFDHRDRAELVQRIGTLDKYVKLREEVQAQQNIIDTVKNDVKEKRQELDDLTDKIAELDAEARKRVDEVERLGATAQMGELAFTYGYSPGSFEALLRTIKNYLDKTPYTTNTQVFEALQEYQSLQMIKEATASASKENDVVRARLNETRGELEAIRDETLQALREARRSSLNQLESHSKASEKQLKGLEEQQKLIIEKSIERLQGTWDSLETKSQEWESKLREIGQYELLLKNSLVLATAYHSPMAAKDIPLRDIAILAQVVDNWVQYNLRGATAITPNEVRNERGFNIQTFMSIPGLSMFLSMELNRRANS